MKLWMKIFIGLIIGVVSGLILEDKAVFVKPFGDIFLNLLSLVVYPLVFCSMVLGIASISDMKKLGRIGLRSLGLYLATTSDAIGIGLAFALFFSPGKGCDLQGFNAVDLASSGSSGGMNFLATFAQVFPSNPLRSFVEGNILQIIIFALFTGIAMRLAGEAARPDRKSVV